MDASVLLWDNPILVKHLRSRLRRNAVIPWALIVVVLSACLAWGGLVPVLLGYSWALSLMLGLQTIILVFIGGHQLTATVGAARVSGILDFHRVSPLPPAAVALGFLLGAPVREYLLAALVLPFAGFIAVLDTGPIGLVNLLQFELPLLLSAWLVHAMGLLACLSTRKPKAGAQGVVGLVLLGLFFGGPLVSGIGYAANYTQQQFRAIDIFGLPVPLILVFPLYELPLIGFFFVACARKMRSDRMHAYTKRQAIGFLATITALILGATWGLMEPGSYLVIYMVYVLSVLAIWLTVTITPDAAEYVRGLRRAIHEGRKRPSPWSDAGTNRIAVFILCAIVAAGPQAAWEFIEGRPRFGGAQSYSLPIVIGVFLVAYFGLGLQYVQLRWGKRAEMFLRLFLFLAWGVPLLVGGIVSASAAGSRIGLPIVALSPIAGIAIASGAGGAEGKDAAQFAALIPAVTFAMLFNYALVATQRRIDHNVRKSLEERALARASNGDQPVELVSASDVH